MRRRLTLVLGALLAAAACAGPGFHGPDILYVATPEDVGLQMLKTAAVTSVDTVYDLGSGDGRLVIAAARDFGARGVGVEIDGPLVQRSKEAALRAGVADRAIFLWQDLFATDIRGATVVTLYLRDDVNLRLRPKLLRELRPGTRVVSHDFGMAEWAPDQQLRVRSADREHTIYFWRIPAEVGGQWTGTLATSGGDELLTLALTQKFQRVTGAFAVGARTWPIADTTLDGDRLAFAAGPYRVSARVSDTTMTGRATDAAGTPRHWTARRPR
ncbi:MAG TPA: SAM-dependent methyltransferase [Methylomirabilota bacterium]|jgi:SAM-dependent methyltransferase|nr:SAM-dependent methyltransferase [Methylomirabilota bacterium]